MRGSIDRSGFRLRTCLVALIALAVIAPSAVHAQQVPPAPPPAPPRRFSSGLTDATVAYARPAGDRGAGQLVLGGACRSRLWNRVTIGPEGFYLRGAGGHRTLMLSASAAIDLVPDLHTRHWPTLVPYLTLGVGVARGRRTGATTAWEGTVSAGGGLRIRVGESMYVGPELGLGREPRVRVGVLLGRRW